MKTRFLTIIVLMLGLLPGMSLTAQAAETTITWDCSQFQPFEFYLHDGQSTTIDGVTLKAIKGMAVADPDDGFMMMGNNGGDSFEFSVAEGNITKIVIACSYGSSTGTGWSGFTWTGSASSVNFGDYANNVTSITFTIEDSTPAAINITANSDGAATPNYWATYYNGSTSYTADENTTVYQAAVNTAKTGVTLTEVSGREIPAGKAVILKSTAESITLTPASTTQTLDGNELQGVDAETTAPSNAYCLSNETTGDAPRGVGFYTYTGTIPAHRAYLVVTDGPSNARGFLGFGDDDNTTGISLPEAVVVEDNGAIYDLSGRRVTGQPQKGIYVKNGKKFVIK